MSHSPFPWSNHPQVPNAVFDADGRRINEAWSPPAEATAWLIHWGDVVPEFTRDIRQAERGRRCGCNVDEFYAASRPSPIDPETAADNAALIAAIPAMVSVLEGLLVDNDGDEGDDACELCDGCGEVSAVTTRSDRDSVGCPACIERASSRAARAVLQKAKQGDKQ